MALKVLTKEQVEQFMENGWVKVEQAFPKEAALNAQQVVWGHVEKRGALQNDPTTWTKEMIQINESYDNDEFQLCNSLRMADAIEDLIGEGRGAFRNVYGETAEKTSYGWWPVNFSKGADNPWDIPTGGWHWDGIQFKHFIDSPDQGLLCLCLFSEIGHHGGGTLIAEGSHKLVAKFLAQYPDGIELKDAIPIANRSHPWLRELTNAKGEVDNSKGVYDTVKEEDPIVQGNRMEKFLNWTTDSDGVRLRVLETTGGPGDVILCHPFLYHAASQNHSGVVRFMCNRTTELKEHLKLFREDPTEYSPLELSIRNALA
jgi:hypothetical protein